VYRRLSSKITALTGIAMVFTVASFTYLMLGDLNRTSLQEAIKDSDYISETIIRTTHHQMLDNHFERVHEMIVEVGNMDGMERIRLFNKRGVVTSSTDDEEIGVVFSADSEVCASCHMSGGVTLVDASPDGRSKIVTNNSGHSVLRQVRGIYNQPSCYTAACHFHPPDVRVLGVLEVQISLDMLRTVLLSFRTNLILFVVCLLVMLAACLYAATEYFVNRPVSRLLDHTRFLSSGKLDTHIDPLADDEIGELTISFNDMTKNLCRAQEELVQMTEGLEVKVAERTSKIEEMQQKLLHSEKMASLGELVAGIAHEINNPLTGIMVFTSMSLEKSELPPEVRSDLRTVLDETQRCADIVKRLLEFSRETPPAIEIVDVNELLEKTFTFLERQVSFHNIIMEKHFSDSLPKIHGDPVQLKQVFMNMLVNASQAMMLGGMLKAGTSLWEEQGVEVYVSDTGCGISEERLKNIFDPFFTTKRNGTGLGLSVSYGIVQNHGGKIDVESRVGEGTTFRIFLPFVHDEQDGSGIYEVTAEEVIASVTSSAG